MATCRMELCTHWSGDGDVCLCAVFGMTPNTPDWANEQMESGYSLIGNPSPEIFDEGGER